MWLILNDRDAGVLFDFFSGKSTNGRLLRVSQNAAECVLKSAPKAATAAPLSAPSLDAETADTSADCLIQREQMDSSDRSESACPSNSSEMCTDETPDGTGNGVSVMSKDIDTSVSAQHIVDNEKLRSLVCPGCDKSFRFKFNLISHVKRVHHGDKEVGKVVDDRLALEDEKGPKVKCLLCDCVRHGSRILRHFQMVHSAVDHFEALYKEMRQKYSEEIRMTKLSARRERKKRSAVNKNVALTQQIESLKSITAGDLTSSSCLLCYAVNFESAESLSHHIETDHQVHWADYLQMVHDYGRMIDSDNLDSDLATKYTKQFCGLCGSHLSARKTLGITLAIHLKTHNLLCSKYLELLQMDCSGRKQYFAEIGCRREFPCPVCRQGFTMMNNLRAHVRRQHKNHPDAAAQLEELQSGLRCGNNFVQCFVCGKERVGTSIIKHMHAAHRSIRDFDTVMQNTRKMLTHVQRSNAKQRAANKEHSAFPCKFCQQMFRCRSTRLRHQISCPENVHRQHLLRCKECNYWTGSSQRLQMHAAKCHSKSATFVCHLCGSSYRRRTSLQV